MEYAISPSDVHSPLGPLWGHLAGIHDRLLVLFLDFFRGYILGVLCFKSWTSSSSGFKTFISSLFFSRNRMSNFNPWQTVTMVLHGFRYPFSSVICQPFSHIFFTITCSAVYLLFFVPLLARLDMWRSPVFSRASYQVLKKITPSTMTPRSIQKGNAGRPCWLCFLCFKLKRVQNQLCHREE